MSFSTRRAAQASGLSERQVRSYVRAGLLSPDRGPGGAFQFSFQDVVILKAGRQLQGQGVPMRRIARALGDLGRGGAGVSLSSLHMEAAGSRVLVRDGVGLWDPTTGQGVIELGGWAEGSEAPVRPGLRIVPVADSRGEDEADDWFEEGLRLEDADPSAARAAYHEAIARQPSHGPAHANLGRLLHEHGDLEAAERHYRLALDTTPDDPTAAFNLGVVLEDLGDPEGALDAYRAALDLDPDYASAHFNAGKILDVKGEKKEALGHFVAYRKSRRSSSPS